MYLNHFLIVWWAFVTGGGFGLGRVGLKIFPIVIIAGLDSIPGTSRNGN
jgi:hypothetical protein